jgi:photosystem II stability/assembly factor-like uncharacterized protein
MTNPLLRRCLGALAAIPLLAQSAGREDSLGGRRMRLPARSGPAAIHGHDRAGARQDWHREWFGGDPGPAYLDFKANLIRREVGRNAPALPAQPSQAARAVWVNLGPFANVRTADFPDVDTGRPVAVVPHPTNPRTLYLALSGGGVFKCVDADLDAPGDWIWFPITDALPANGASGNLSLGALALNPQDPETLYLGLGDPHFAEGRGLYRSADGGESWTAASGLGAATRTYAILPLDRRVVFWATNDGLKRSDDGGLSFAPATLGDQAGGQVWSLQAFDRLNLVCSRLNAGTGEIWYSGDGGITWGLADILGVNPGRITLATTPASATLGWGLAQAKGLPSMAGGLLRTLDKGRTWTFIPAPAIKGGLFQGVGSGMALEGNQADYNQLLAVDPEDANRVFAGANLALYRTQDGGASWTQLTHWYADQRVYAHADFQASAWSLAGPRVLFIANDGGLCILRQPRLPDDQIPTGPAGQGNPMASRTSFLDNRRNAGLAAHLVFNLGSTPASTPADSPWRITLGLQDNGTRVRQGEGGPLGESGVFEDRVGGDGFGTLIHPLNGNLMLGSLYYLSILRSEDGGRTPFQPSYDGIPGAGWPGTGPFVTPLLAGTADPSGNTVFTFNYFQVFRSPDFGLHWFEADTSGTDLPRHEKVIRHMNASRTNPLAFAVAISGGNGWITADGGATWRPFGALPGHDRYLSYVEFSPFGDQNLLLASVAPTPTANHLWISEDGGRVWRALDRGPSGEDNGFPFGIPVHTARFDPKDPQRIYAGTDFGLYASGDGGRTWSRPAPGLPLVAVRDLYLDPAGAFLRAATFGRGVWELRYMAAAKTRDLNGDGAVDVLDLAVLARAWSGRGVLSAFPEADLDGDGDVDEDDLAILWAGF